MGKTRHREVLRRTGYDIHIIGAPLPGIRDIYHALLRMPGWTALGAIVGSYLLLNVFYALMYLWLGGVANARAGSFADAFFFSVQTMGTIGYGTMYPVGRAGNLLMLAESVTSLVVTALATGLVFARFSQTRARLLFSAKVAIGPSDGIPTLMLRVGNERRGNIVGTEFRLSFTRTSKTAEGVTVYLMQDLPLVRARAPALARAWNVMHRIVEGSPLYGYDAAKLAEVDGELQLEVMGLDDTSLQPVHALNTWFAGAVAWDARLADVLSESPDGDLILDLGAFHEVVSIS
jgi:inward rectifier potassium channel